MTFFRIVALLSFLFLFVPRIVEAQSDQPVSAVNLGGFIDAYFTHGYNNSFTRERPYTTQALRDDQLRINLSYLEAKLNNDTYRGRLAIQGGDSVKANYSSESDLFWRYIQESTLGYKLNDKLWIDGGIYLSHIGLESFNSKDNWNYTRSLVAEYSPYYETGIKLSYQFNDQWSCQFHLLNGWQNISSKRDPAVGMQLAWSPTRTVQITYNSFFGNEHGERTFNELLGKVDITDRWSVASQFDIGNQNRHQGQDDAWWHGWAVLTQYRINSVVTFGGRIERYSDPQKVVINVGSGERFSVVGMSANVDTVLNKNLLWRNEYRAFVGNHNVFPGDRLGSYRSSDSFIVSSLSYSF